MNALLDLLPGPLPVKLALLALPMLPNLWGIWHAYKHRFYGPEQIIWMMACIFLPLIGGLAYLLIGRTRTVRAVENSSDV